MIDRCQKRRRSWSSSPLAIYNLRSEVSGMLPNTPLFPTPSATPDFRTAAAPRLNSREHSSRPREQHDSRLLQSSKVDNVFTCTSQTARSLGQVSYHRFIWNTMALPTMASLMRQRSTQVLQARGVRAGAELTRLAKWALPAGAAGESCVRLSLGRCTRL